MTDETLLSRYKKKLENNKFFAVLAITIALLSAITAAFSGTKALLAYFSPAPPPPPPKFEEQVAELAKKGCILFVPDSVVPESNETFIANAYKDFWRKTDIYYADRIEIFGVTHSRGSREYNISLGERKASAAKDFLEKHARVVPELTEIVIISYGEELPIERAGEYECGAIIRVFHNEKVTTNSK